MNDDDDLFSFDFTKPTARASDPETSHEAAEDASFHASYGRRLVLQALSVRPMTDFELAELTGWQQTSIGKRRHECMEAGLVCVLKEGEDKVAKRPAPSGSMARVWRLTDKAWKQGFITLNPQLAA